ncbi:hypothetical protein FOCC_FOCC008472 [Frankliniella occidentalis]|nr:hypothetical protein FOCC_FOCC008472 [Frankliniella occidentalis]
MHRGRTLMQEMLVGSLGCCPSGWDRSGRAKRGQTSQLSKPIALQHQRELLQEEDRNKAESEAEKCSQLVLRKLHHLVSTKSTPGVFNSPRNPSVKAVEDGLRQLRFHSMPSSVSTNNGLADQVRALDWEATRSRKLSVQRALHLPETWKTRLRSLQSIST